MRMHCLNWRIGLVGEPGVSNRTAAAPIWPFIPLPSVYKHVVSSLAQTGPIQGSILTTIVSPSSSASASPAVLCCDRCPPVLSRGLFNRLDLDPPLDFLFNPPGTFGWCCI